MQTTVTIWIPKSDLENFIKLEKSINRTTGLHYVLSQKYKHQITIYTEKMHVDCLQLNVSLDLFLKLNLK